MDTSMLFRFVGRDDVTSVFQGIASNLARTGAVAGAGLGASLVGSATPVILGGLATIAASGAQVMAAGGVLGIGIALAKETEQVQAAAGRLGETFKSAFAPLGQIFAGPVAGALDKFAGLAGPIASTLEPVMRRLAPTIGTITDGLVGLVTAALPGFQALADAGAGFFEQLGPLLPDIGAALGDLMTTMAGAAPLFQQIFLGALAATPAILRGVASGMQWLMDAFDAFKVGLSGFSVNESFGFFDGLGFGIRQVGDAIQGFRTGLSGFTANEVATPFERAGMAVRGLINGFRGVTENEVATPFERVGMAVRSAADFMGRLSAAVSPVSQALQALLSGDKAGASAAMERFRPIIDGVKGLVDTVRTGGGQIKAAFDKALTPERMAAIQEIWGKVKVKLDELVAWLQPKMDQVFQIIGDVFKLISVVVGAEMAAVAAAIGPTLDWIERFWKKHGDDIIAMAKGAWEMISSLIGGALDVVQGIIRTVTAVMQGDWSAAADGLRQVWDGLWTIIKGVATGAWEFLKNGFIIFSSVMEFIGRKIADGLRWAFQQAKDWAVGKMNELQDWLAGLPGRLLNAIGDIGSKFKDLGGNMIDGVIRGLRGAASRLVRAAKDVIASSPLGSVMRALDINSPSGVYRDQVGRQMAAGAEEGITDGAASLASATAAAMPSPALGGAGRAGGPVVINVDLRGAVGVDDRMLVDRLRRALADLGGVAALGRA